MRWIILTALVGAGCVTDMDRRDPAAVAEARAVDFLKREVPAWSRDNGCFSCHNNGDAARALFAATRKGHRIPTRVLADTTAWVTQPNRWDHNKGDPGFSDKRLASIQFAASLSAAVEAGHVRNRRPLQEAARKVAAEQGADGAWPIELQNAVGSPATYGTTLATYVALKTLRDADPTGTTEAIRKAEAWLRQVKPGNVLAAATLLLAETRENAQGQLKPHPADEPGSRGRESAHSEDQSNQRRLTSADTVRGFDARTIPSSVSLPGVRTSHSMTLSPTVQECLNLIRRAQTRDGGWGPYADSPPEPFDTAVVLLALQELRAGTDVGEMIQRGREFLVAQQLADGSWPATTRPPGGDSYAQRVSTTGWATLALLATRKE